MSCQHGHHHHRLARPEIKLIHSFPAEQHGKPGFGHIEAFAGWGESCTCDD